MRDYQKQVINAAVQEDIISILKEKGMLEDIVAGNVKCINCDEPILPDMIGAIIIKDNILRVCCNNLECIEEIRK